MLLLFHVQVQLEKGGEEDEKREDDAEQGFHLAAAIKVGKTHVLDAGHAAGDDIYGKVVNAVNDDARYYATCAHEYPSKQ